MFFLVALNFFLTPTLDWSIYPCIALLLWPLSLYHARKGSFFAYSVQASIWVSAFMIGMNWAFSPSVIWAIYPIFAVVWWPLSMYFFRVKHHMHSL